MKIVAIANRKGGVGKSTVATHLAGALARRGQNVLLIDTDPQGHAGLCLGIRKESGLFRLLVDNAPFEEVLRPVNPANITTADDQQIGHLFALPSDERTQVIPMLEQNPFAFMQRLEEIDSVFDWAILDTAPTVTMFDGAVYLATQAFLYVTECEKLSRDGLANGLKQIKDFAPQRQGMPAAYILGIVPNKLREKTQNHAANLDAIRERYGDLVWEAIPQRTTLTEATNFGKLIWAYAPSSDAARLMDRLALQFEQAVAVWQAN